MFNRRMFDAHSQRCREYDADRCFLKKFQKDAKLTMQPGHETRELTPPTFEPLPVAVTSVRETTTRSFEPLEQKRTG